MPAQHNGKRLLLLATKTGYQTRAFAEAARRLSVELVYGTDRCHVLEDPWGDRALPLRFEDPEASSQQIRLRALLPPWVCLGTAPRLPISAAINIHRASSCGAPASQFHASVAFRWISISPLSCVASPHSWLNSRSAFLAC